MERDKVAMIKLKIPAGSATMGGTIAPALGQKGVKAKDFVDEFNKRTAHLPKGIEIHTTIFVLKDKTFTFKFNTESVSDRIKKMLNLKTCAAKPGIENVATMTMDQVRKIAEEKMIDTCAESVEKMCNTVIGTAKSMGIMVK